MQKLDYQSSPTAVLTMGRQKGGEFSPTALEVSNSDSDFTGTPPKITTVGGAQLSSARTISIHQLVEEVGTNYEAMRKRLRRSGYDGSLEEIPMEVADKARSQRSAVRSRTKAPSLPVSSGTADRSEIRDAGSGTQTDSPFVSIPQVADSPSLTLPQGEGIARPVVFARTWFLYVVYLAALGWQVWHTAAVVVRADSHSPTSPQEGGVEPAVWSWVSGLLFALSVQFTALLMTIRTNSLLYLRGFAVVEFLFNCAYYEPYRAGATWSEIVTELLISAAIAFTIYSYSELFTKTMKA